MSGRGFTACLGLLFALRIAAGGAAAAENFADCVRDAASRHLAAKTAFQRGLRDLIARNRPEYESLATLSMDLQILLAEARRARFDYLLAHDPGRIETAKGLGQFTNFDWSSADSAGFMEASGPYRELENRVAVLEEQNNGHPDWPALRAYFRAELARSADYMALTEHLRTRQAEVEAVIAQCRHE